MRSVALTCLVGVAVAARSERSTSSLGVLGLGSNVVDRFYKIRGPGMEHVAGQKGYFASAGEVVGGVTLNHLSWARSLGVPSALAALQGDDESGRLIREAMATHGVSTDAVTVEQSAISSVSHVIIDSAGERTILMAPHATATIDDVAVERLFSEAVSRCAVVTTEVSQVPLSGVAALLQHSLRHFGLGPPAHHHRLQVGCAQLKHRHLRRRCAPSQDSRVVVESLLHQLEWSQKQSINHTFYGFRGP